MWWSMGKWTFLHSLFTINIPGHFLLFVLLSSIYLLFLFFSINCIPSPDTFVFFLPSLLSLFLPLFKLNSSFPFFILFLSLHHLSISFIQFIFSSLGISSFILLLFVFKPSLTHPLYYQSLFPPSLSPRHHFFPSLLPSRSLADIISTYMRCKDTRNHLSKRPVWLCRVQ